jgi:hypothetical protein
MLTNEDRQESLRIFSSLYAARDLNTMLHYMPKDVNDSEGEVFNQYFDFLQSLYSLRSDVKSMESESELDERLLILYDLAKKFNYPIDIIEAFYG